MPTSPPHQVCHQENSWHLQLHQTWTYPHQHHCSVQYSGMDYSHWSIGCYSDPTPSISLTVTRSNHPGNKPTIYLSKAEGLLSQAHNPFNYLGASSLQPIYFSKSSLLQLSQPSYWYLSFRFPDTFTQSSWTAILSDLQDTPRAGILFPSPSQLTSTNLRQVSASWTLHWTFQNSLNRLAAAFFPVPLFPLRQHFILFVVTYGV